MGGYLPDTLDDMEGLVEPAGGNPEEAARIRKILERPPGTPAAPPQSATAPGGPAPIGQGMIAGGSTIPAEAPDPLGIKGMGVNIPVENMSPGRIGLARSVLGMGEKGSATIGRAGQEIQGTIENLPKTFPEFMEKIGRPETARSILRGSGGAAGAMLGAPAGVPGIIIGTGVGATAGGWMANMYEDVRNLIENTPSIIDRKGAAEYFLRPAYDGSWDAMFSGAAVSLPGASRHARQFIASRIFKLPPDSVQMMNMARDIGVDIGVANVANGGIGKGAVNVMGRFPMLGTSAKKASEQQGKAIVKAYDEMFEPLATHSASAEIGEAALTAARAKFGDFAVKAQGRYEHALRVGEEAGAIVNSDGILRATGEVMAQISSKVGKLQGVPPADMRAWLNGLQRNVDGPLSTPEANSILNNLEGLLRQSQGKHGIHYDKLEKIQAAVVKSLEGTDHPAARLLLGARSNFQEGIREFETSIYKKMVGTVDRNIYAIGKIKGGTMNADELMEVANKTNSATAFRDLRTAAGDDTVRHVARARIDDAWFKATSKEPGTFFIGDKLAFDAKKFNEALGLNNPNSAKYFATKEMLRGTEVAISDLEKLAKVTQMVTNAPIADASTFMARSAVLRGGEGIAEAIRSTMTLGTAGKTVGTMGLPAAYATLVVSRWGLGQMMKPGLIKLLNTAMDPVSRPDAAAAAIVEMTRHYPALFNE
jgi:hypothetical protein